MRSARIAVMPDMVSAIARQVLPGGRGAEPGADHVVESAGAEERVVGGVVHEDREREMAAAEQDRGDEHGEDGGLPGYERERTQDQGPGRGDGQPAPEVGGLVELPNFLRAEDLGDLHGWIKHLDAPPCQYY